MSHRRKHGYEHEGSQGEKLYLIKSPVVGDKVSGSHASSVALDRDASNPNLQALGYGDGLDHATPEFQKVGLDFHLICDYATDCIG